MARKLVNITENKPDQSCLPVTPSRFRTTFDWNTTVYSPELPIQPQKDNGKQIRPPAVLGQELPDRLFHTDGNRVTFLVGPGHGTSKHHEPPRYEMEDAGLPIDELSIIETDEAGHALMHMERYLLFHNKNDKAAAEYLIKKMSPAQKKKYREIQKSEEITGSVRNMILERVDLFGLV